MKEKIETLPGEPIEKNAITPVTYPVFREQINDGVRFYEKISGEQEEATDVYPEQLLLLSFLNANDSVSLKKPVNTPVLTEYGLEIKGNLYGFKPKFREQVLRFEIGQLFRIVPEGGDFYETLSAQSRNFRKKYEEAIYEHCVQMAKPQFLAEMEEVKRQINSRYLQKTPATFGGNLLRERLPDLPDEEVNKVFRAAWQCMCAKDKLDAWRPKYDQTRMTLEVVSKELETQTNKYLGIIGGYLETTSEEDANEPRENNGTIEMRKMLRERYLETTSKEDTDEPQEDIDFIGMHKTLRAILRKEKTVSQDGGIKEEESATFSEYQKAVKRVEKAKNKYDSAKNEFDFREGSYKRVRERYEEKQKELGIRDLDPLELARTAQANYLGAKNSFILDNNYLTREEYAELRSYASRRQELLSPIIESKVKGRSYVIGAFNELQAAITAKLGERYDVEYSKEYDFPELQKMFMRSPESISTISVKKARENLENQLESIFGSSDPFDNIDDFIELTKRFFTLKEKYRRGEIRFGPTPQHAVYDIQTQRAMINNRMNDEVEAIASKDASRLASSIERKAAELVLGREDLEAATFVPNGCIVKYKNGNLGAFAISPFDSRIELSLEPYEAKAWGEAWSLCRNEAIEANGRNNPAGLADFANKRLRQVVGAYIQSASNGPVGHLREMQEEYGFTIPGLFAPNSRMNRLPTTEEINALSDIMPYISGLVDEVEFDGVKLDGRHDMSLNGIVKTLRALLGDSKPSYRNASPIDLVGVRGGKITLNFPLYRRILNDVKKDNKEARSILCACLGYELFRNLDEESLGRFLKALDKSLDASPQFIFRMFGVRVHSPKERRKIVARVCFINELDKFAAGKSGPEMESFFRSLGLENNQISSEE